MMYSGGEISSGIGGLGIASYSFRIADDSPRAGPAASRYSRGSYH